MIDENIEYSIGSDPEFKDLVADIGIQDQLIALLTQEEGYENMRIRIFPPINQKFWDLNLKDFENAIENAKKRLYDLKKE